MKTKELNVCFDTDGEVKCATSFQTHCNSCPNKESSVKRNLLLEPTDLSN